MISLQFVHKHQRSNCIQGVQLFNIYIPRTFTDNGVIYEIAERVKQRRRPVTNEEVQQAITTLDSSESIRHV